MPDDRDIAAALGDDKMDVEGILKAIARLKRIEAAARPVLESMVGTCDYGEPPCQGPSFAGFMHAMCDAHAEELDAPMAALKDQSLVTELKNALDGV